MSLLNELNPEVRKQLEADKEQYPNLYKMIINDVEEADLVTDLNLGTANYLVGYYESAVGSFSSNNFLLNVYQVFGK